MIDIGIHKCKQTVNEINIFCQMKKDRTLLKVLTIEIKFQKSKLAKFPFYNISSANMFSMQIILI